DFESIFALTHADQQINNDPDNNFRVFDETSEDPFKSTRASYHHNSIGGYHAARLGLYEDIINNQLVKKNKMVFNMLNTKYFIRRDSTSGRDEAIINPDAFGPCWLVHSVKYVKNADEEMNALNTVNLKDTAVIDNRYRQIDKYDLAPDNSASIKLIEN